MNTLALLLPALMPSWRFFDGIAASPRIEFARLDRADGPPIWQEFKPRPARLSASEMLCQVFWNPGWNEYLFLVSCCERLRDDPETLGAHSLNVIRDCLARDVPPCPYLQFRIIFLREDEAGRSEDISYLSGIEPFGPP